MPRVRPRLARTLLTALRRLARAQDGSFLVEAMASSLIIVIVGFGVLESIDRSSRLGTQQEIQAVAGNVAQSEMEQLRALPLDEQSNLRRSTTRTVDGVPFSIASRADWVNDASGESGCTTAGGSADYMKISTVVSWPQMATRKPVTLESIVTPGVRSFGAGQGSLAVQVTNANGTGVSGLPLSLSGPRTLSDTTSSSGCVLWGYLPAAGGYTMAFSRPPDYVTPTGATSVSAPVTIVGEQTANVAVQYDRGGYLSTSFVTRRTAGGADMPTNPQVAHVTHSGAGGVSVSYAVSGSSGTSGLLFPFSSPYTVHSDSCSASDVPASPEDPVPDLPAAPQAVTGTVTRGVTTATATLRIPSPNIRVTSNGTAVVGKTVRVRTPCGTEYRRTTIANGVLDDPGFPYTTLAICVTDGVRQLEVSRSNRNFNTNSNFTMNVTSTSPLGTCA
jgi:hypothetical protein